MLFYNCSYSVTALSLNCISHLIKAEIKNEKYRNKSCLKQTQTQHEDKRSPSPLCSKMASITLICANMIVHRNNSAPAGTAGINTFLKMLIAFDGQFQTNTVMTLHGCKNKDHLNANWNSLAY